ncbi:MAG: TolB family protein [Thermoleophilaceae bacterium]
MFQYGRAQGTAPTGWGIWVMNVDGTGARQVSRDAETVARGDTYPAWSPNADEIAYVRDPDLYVMNLNGRGVRNLTSTFTRTAIDPEWSPNGALIAFSDGGDVHVVPADGSAPPRLVTTAPGNQRYPSWSPDGSKIAYADIGEVGTINPDGTGDTTILSGRREVWDLAWSPNGQRIAFIEDPGTDISVQEELFMMNADGSGARALGVDTNISLDWAVPAAAPPPPVIGDTANVREVKGKVFVGIPSSGARVSQKGVDFVPLEEARQIPVGAFLDTTKGTVALTTARNRAGKVQSGKFSAGLFQVLQSRKRAAKGLTELRLKGSTAGFRNCRSGGGARASALSRRTVRRLRANAKGRYRSRGRHSAATVRGTKWVMEDRCDGTLTTVKRGSVTVRDFRLKKNITVTAGKSYLAR